MKKFEAVATVEGSPKWENAIKRERELYNPRYGTPTMRSIFDRDYTRIINCNAYKRLRHKTQVFFAPENDHICTRLEHVSIVESISHTISNYLGLNDELTKAIAIAHDIGHTPFGHKGEAILSEISEREIGEPFWHARNGLRFVEDIELLKDYEYKLRNLSLTYAVRDGIIAHSGSPNPDGLKPRDEVIDLKKEFLRSGQFNPYTWEGCVVKIADNIAYLGRDIDDAILMHLLTKDEIAAIDETLEKIRINNSSIVNYFVVDLCENSFVEEGLKFSKEGQDTMNKLLRFNYKYIYDSDRIAPTIRYFTVVMSEIYYILKNRFDGKNTINNIKKMGIFYPELSREFIEWLGNYSNIDERQSENYDNKIIYDIENIEDYKRSIIEYISGMTDNYIRRIYNGIVGS